MAPKFGTSGLRGLVVELTPDLVASYIRAFLRSCPIGKGLYVARDLRPSSPEIAQIVIDTARSFGVDVVDCGAAPTPALALAAMGAGAGAVMVTGSHIPADRNGLKFYLPSGEITKADEQAILAALDLGEGAQSAHRIGDLTQLDCGPAWVARYVEAFGKDALFGLKIGLWSHSAVSRDMVLATLQHLGAEVVELGRSDVFIPVDTEAVPQWAREQIALWVNEYGLDALVSTDGDGDRPLLADATGRIIVGDILGQITARVVGADHVATPINANSGVEMSQAFAKIQRSKIGSPFVIAAMADLGGNVVGYEANGGFLLGFDAKLKHGDLRALATRDSLLPLVAPLSLAHAAGGLAAVVAREPARVTAADRLEDVPVAAAQGLIERLRGDEAALAQFLAALGETLQSRDETDGLRVICASHRIVHLRPSGNAPELRLYTEAETSEAAQDLLARGLALLRTALAARAS